MSVAPSHFDGERSRRCTWHWPTCAIVRPAATGTLAGPKGTRQTAEWGGYLG